MRGVGFRGFQAPFAAAGKVRPNPFPVRTGALSVDLNGSVALVGVLHRRQLVKPVQRERRTLSDFGITVGVVEQLGSVGAHRAFGGRLFG